MTDLPPDVIERAQRKVDAVLAKIIGGVMLWIGLAFGGLFVWFLFATLNRSPDLAVLLVLAVFAVLAAFCSLVGWRLFLNRPNRFGSILTPRGWRILGGMFGILAAGSLALWVVLLRDGASTELQVTAVTSIAWCALFCHWCLVAARKALANATKSHGAL